jgi:hypothetical protein
MSARPPDIDKEPSTYYEIEKNRLVNPGESRSGGVPKLPPESPWAADVVGPEPTIDRSQEDGNTINIHGDTIQPTEEGE